jgi:NTE family protein
MGALFDVDGKFTGRVGLVLTRLNARGAELRNDIQIGAIQSLESKFYQPLEFSGTIFVVPGILLQNDDQSIFDEEGGEIAVYAVNRRLATLEAGVHLGRLGELRGGIARGSASAEVEVGSADLPDVDVDVGGFLGRIIVDRLDSASFPNRGYIAGTEVFLSRRGLGADDSYDRIEVAASRFWPQGRNIWLLGGQLGGSLGSELPPYHQFTLGGFLSLSGLERGQLRGPYAGVLRGGLLHRLADGAAPILKGVYLGALVEAGNVWEHSGEIGEAPILSATGLLGVDTALGPLYFAYGVADTGQDELYVSLGQTF